ncbi:MAG: copper oxidase [Proteobacteria bacterium]|nr:copper oxidase [Pseudomonadota bacterium]
MTSRRSFLSLSGTMAAAGAAIGIAKASAQGHAGHGPAAADQEPQRRSPQLTTGTAPSAHTRVPRPPADGAFRPVVTPNGSSLPWIMKDGVKEFRLVAQPVKREFAPGMVVNAWGYNGMTPGPTIEAVEGDRVRILVKNEVPEWTTIHWHGMRLPNGMDGVGGLTQLHIPVGKTGVYEFTLEDPATYMYHPHADEMVQMAMGLMGFFIVHPRNPATRAVDRDFAIMLHAWDVKPGTATPNVATMLDFNIWTFNSRAFPGTDILAVRAGDRVRIRLANLSMTSHPVHLHGHHMLQTATDGGTVPEGGRWPMNTVNVPVGSTVDVEWIADRPGDWALHCHKAHHAMNAMAHDLPNFIGVSQGGDLQRRVNALLPQYMAMGSSGMAEMSQMDGMPLPPNTLPMLSGKGPFGPMEMGGMFTVVKVREGLAPGDYRDPGWYRHPPGTVMRVLDA